MRRSACGTSTSRTDSAPRSATGRSPGGRGCAACSCAGGDPSEAAEVGEAFGAIGATRLLATRLDTTRRLGSVLAAADAAPLMFCDVSAGPHVVNGVTSINAGMMARMIVPSPDKPSAHPQTPRAEASPL